jgi:Transposase
LTDNRENFRDNREFASRIGKRQFLAHLFRSLPDAICSPLNFADEENKMADEILTRTRYGEAFWRAHHEAWRRSELNQRQYCEAQGIPLKAFGNWRAKFKAEPQLPERKLLYRRGGLSHTLSHSLRHTLSHVTYPSSWSEGPVVAPARDGHRRRFSEADKRRILEEAAEPNASLAKIARRYGIARRVLCRWKQELAPPVFVAVQINDAGAPSGVAPADEECVP